MLRFILGLLVLAGSPVWAQAPVRTPLQIVAAEAVYADVAAQLAGPDGRVRSVLEGVAQDPHAFEPTPSAARWVADAAIVVLNGVDYDPWMRRLLSAGRAPARQVVDAGQVAGRATGGNPHLWFDPAVMPAVARALAAALDRADPAHGRDFETRLQAFLAAHAAIDARVAALRGQYAGTPVTATEPVFGLMAGALGLIMRNERFQRAVQNEVEPRPSDVAAFEADLRQRRVRVLFFNSQSPSAAARRLMALARANGVMVVAVTEAKPDGMSYQDWILAQLDATEQALTEGRQAARP